jgi:hypothetical protein
MLQTGSELYLAEETLGAQSGGEFRMEDLQSDRAIVSKIVGEEHCGHATAPKLALDVVAIGESGPQAIDGSVGQFGESEKDSTRLASGFGRNQ